MKIKFTLITVLVAAVIAVTPTSSSATIINFGSDIVTNGSYNEQGFFSGDNDGRTLNSVTTSLTLILNTPSIFGGYIMNSAWLFVDAVWVDNGDVGQVNVQGIYLGNLADTAHESTNIPVISGPPSSSVHSTIGDDIDNSFYNLGALGVNLNDLATDSTFTVDFVRTAGAFRVDGINIQADATLVPEPASLSLLGLGFFGLIGFRRKKI